MFYSHEILALRKHGKLSRCWLAGTLSEKMFKKTVSNKVVSSVNITATCDEILKFVNNNSSNEKLRFSLYASSQLMYGVTKLFKIQVYMFQDSLFRIKTDLIPLIDLTSKRKKRTGEANEVDVAIQELPLEVLNFGDLHLREDLNLMPEVDLKIIRDFNMRNHVASPTFGALTDQELDIMLFNEADIRFLESLDNNWHTVDESRDQPRSPDRTTDMHHFGLSDRLAPIGESTETRTPQKRRTAAAIVDTPTKKLRRGLGQEMDAAFESNKENIPPFILPADVPTLHGFGELPRAVQDRPSEILAELPMDVEVQRVDESAGLQPEAPKVPAPPTEQHAVDAAAPADGDLPPEIQDSVAAKAKQTRRRRVKRIDEHTQLPENQFGKLQFTDPTVYTITWVPPVSDRKRGLLAKPLLLQPMTSRYGHCAADGPKWARTLTSNFERCTAGPFVAANDTTLRAEAVRLAESVLHSGSIETSNRLKDTTGPQPPSRDKTAEDAAFPLEHEATARPVVPEVPEDVSGEPMNIALASITDQFALQDISEDPENVPPPELSVPPIPRNIHESTSGTATVSIAQLPLSDVPESETPNRRTSSDSNTGNADAFLPRNLRKKDVGEKTRRERIPAGKATVETGDSPTSISSQQSPRSAWVKADLEAHLEVLWRDRRTLTFENLAPVETTKAVDAADCFTLLLELSKDGKVFMGQTEAYGPIYITKRTAAAATSGTDRDEA